jgi:hypothetical protein
LLLLLMLLLLLLLLLLLFHASHIILSGRLMKLAVTEIRDTGTFKSYPQPAGDWVTYKNAPQEVRTTAASPPPIIFLLSFCG